jgi:hypothetical protein
VQDRNTLLCPASAFHGGEALEILESLKAPSFGCKGSVRKDIQQGGIPFADQPASSTRATWASSTRARFVPARREGRRSAKAALRSDEGFNREKGTG